MDGSDDFAHRTETFLQWFKSIKGTTFHKDIEIRDLRNRNVGRGIGEFSALQTEFFTHLPPLVATADIAADTTLFTIPRSCILCQATSELANKLPDVFREDGAAEDDSSELEDSLPKHDSWTRLILILMYELLKDGRSTWEPYFGVLPRSFDTPMFWNDGEIEQLQASPVVSMIGKHKADKMLRSMVLPVIKAHKDIFIPETGRWCNEDLSDAKLMELGHRMGSIIMAYAFDLEEDDKDEENETDDGWVEDREGQTMMGMVPMADMLNADAEPNAHIHHGENELTATTLRPIQAGEEILNYYGPLSNGELLRRYGYTSPLHRRFDVAEVPWSYVLAGLESELGLSSADTEDILDKIDLDAVHGMFTFDRNLGGPDETGRLSPLPPKGAFDELPEDLKETVNAFFKAGRKVRPHLFPPRDKETLQRVGLPAERALNAVGSAVTRRLADYSTTVDDDACALTSTKTNCSLRERMAFEVRMGEKRLLQEVLDWLDSEIIADKEKDVQGPPSKRRRRE